MARYGKGIMRYRLLLRRDKRNKKTKVLVIHGAGGLGKSALIEYLVGTEEVFWKSQGDEWWDGYQNEPVVVLDDLDGTFFKFRYLLRLLDRYPFKVQTKGGMLEFNSKLIIITSNVSPEEWYPNCDTKLVTRRIEEVVHVQKPIWFQEPLKDRLKKLVNKWLA